MDTLGSEISKAAEVVKAGGIILYPTDTIWGLGCDATNEEAVSKLHSIKKRDPSRPMIILVANEVQLESYIDEVPEIAFELMEVSDKPLTLVLEGARRVAENIKGPGNTIGIRICRTPFVTGLIQKTRVPLVSTSANFSGEPSPVNFNSIDEGLIRLADYVFPAGPHDNDQASPSSIISVGRSGTVKVLRK